MAEKDFIPEGTSYSIKVAGEHKIGADFNYGKTVGSEPSLATGTVIDKDETTIDVCYSRAKENCSACLANGWARRRKCQAPIRS